MAEMRRCAWARGEEMQRYHDEEWGRPCHDDGRLFEMLLLEGFQAGLSWAIVLRKREAFRAALDGFAPAQVAAYGEADIQRLLANPAIIRSERKLRAAVDNARAFLRIQEEFGSFDAYLWGFSDGKTILYNKHADGWIPVSNGLSARVAADLRRRGFKYLGPTTVYSHLQACGIINDHSRDCPRYAAVNALGPTVEKRRYLEKGVRHYE